MTSHCALRAFSIALAFFALASSEPASANGGFTFDKIILQGDPAPGTEAGTVFGNAFTYVPLVPHISETGDVAIAAFLSGPQVNASNHTGLWAGMPGALSLVARAGSPAPGTPAGVVFRSFPVDFDPFAPELGNGHLAFHATLSGTGVGPTNDAGVWTRAAGTPTLVARKGDAAPGTAAGVVFADMFLLGAGNSGALTISAHVSGPGTSSATDEGFWTDRSGSLALILREGGSAPGIPGVVFGGAGQFIGTGYSFQSPSFSDAAEFAGEANLTGAGVNTFNNEAIWREQGTQLSLLAREGDPAPGAGGGVTFGGNGVTVQFGAVQLNELGQAAFTTRLGGSVSTSMAMFSDHTGSLAPLVMPGDPAPGTSDDFGIFSDPMLSDGGRAAFRASLASGGMWPPLGIFWDAPGSPGNLVPLVLPGDPLPGSPGTTILGTNFLYGFNAAGQLAFSASLDDAQYGFREALFFADPSGEIQVVVENGRPFDVNGDGSDLRTLSQFHFGGMNDAGTIALRLDFVDGTFGFYTARPSVATSVLAGAVTTDRLRLMPTSPNPFRASTAVRFELPRPSRVTVDVLDVAGRLVARLLDAPRDAGRHAIAWDGTSASGRTASAGMYFVRVSSDAGSAATKMVRLD